LKYFFYYESTESQKQLKMTAFCTEHADWNTTCYTMSQLLGNTSIPEVI